VDHIFKEILPVFSQILLCQWLRLVGLASLLALVGVTLGANEEVKAEIVPDNSLGNESSRITPPNSNAPQIIIRGGASRDVNLFHSFKEFNVNERQSVLFNPQTEIQNIITRVTGSNRSEIRGTLGVIGSNANLFLINPNGIIFGPNARLFMPGSFVATTANAISFENHGFFTTENPNSPPLLTVNPTALLFNQIPSQPIINTSRGIGLRISSGGSLLLVGGDVKLEGGILQTLGGSVGLGGLAEVGTLGLNVEGNNLDLSFPQNVRLADVSLTDGSQVNVSAIPNSSGKIQIAGRLITLSGGSEIINNNLEPQPGGILNLTASELVELNGASKILAQTGNSGTGGDLIIETKRLMIRDGSQISTDTFSSGQGGTITIKNAEVVELSGNSPENQISSRLTTEARASGKAGNVTIETRKLMIRDGAQIAAGTFNEGEGGTITLNVSDSIELSGTSLSGISSRIITQTDGIGNAGLLRIETGRLTVQNGAQISTATTGSGLGGTLELVAQQLSINNSAQITTSSTGVGSAGEINVNANFINLDNQAKISADTRGGRGNIKLESPLLILRRSSSITTNASGSQISGGNINLNAKDGFIIAVPRENSDIRADSRDFRGGNVIIDNATGIFGIEPRTVPTETTNDITAKGATPEFRGTVEINRTDINQNLGIVELPITLADASSITDTGCAPTAGDEESEFIITGRGGLPPNPYEPLDTDVTWIDTRITTITPQQRALHSTKPQSRHERKDIEPASGWVFNGKGDVTLISHAHSKQVGSRTCPKNYQIK
jgi:filamentous hemagglutinin family protein